MTTPPSDHNAQEEHKKAGISPEFIGELRDVLGVEDNAKVKELTAELHPADIAEILNKVRPEDANALITTLGDDFSPEILPYLEADIAEEVVELLGRSRFASMLPQLDSDDVVEVIEELEEDDRKDVLEAMSARDRAVVEQTLQYPEDSAGRLMQREMVAVPDYWNVKNALEALKNPNLPKDYYDVFVVDAKYHPVGVVRLSRLLQADPEEGVTDLMEKKFWPVEVEQDQAEVATLFRKYGLVTAPVINKDNRLIGIITVDDVVEVIEEEAEEDIMHLGGVSEQDTRSAALETISMRLPWLMVNLATAFLAAYVVSHFTDTIDKLVELAVLMSIVPSLSGNAGTQTLTVVVRGLATKEIDPLNIIRVIRKEVIVGLANGLFLALFTGAAAALWFQHIALGLTIAIAMVGNFFVAGTMGALIPIFMSKHDIDPAVGSSVVLTALTDAAGFFLFLGVASLLLL